MMIPLKKGGGGVYQPHVSINTLLLLLLLATTTTTIVANAATADIAGLALFVGPETVMSGSTLNDCDPSPTSGACIGGLPAMHKRARLHVDTYDSTVLILPQLDAFSVLPSLHPDGVELNLKFYDRINSLYVTNNTKVKVPAYFAYPADLARGGDTYTALKLSSIPSLSSTMDVPVDSDWRFVVKNALVVDLTTMESVPITDAIASRTTNPKCAILSVNDATNLWTTSTSVSPLKYGTRLGGDHFVVDEDLEADDTAGTYSTARTVGTLVSSLRRGVGVVVMMGYDTTIPATTLLEDMLAMEIENEYLASNTTTGNFVDSSLFSHLPDVFIDVTADKKSPYMVTISVSYITSAGLYINKTRDVMFVGIPSDSMAVFDMQLNLADVQAAVGLRSNAVNVSRVVTTDITAFFTRARVTPAKYQDEIYLEDQAVLLNYTRTALLNDDVIGHTVETVPFIYNSTIKTSNCFSSECAQGTIIARSLRVQLDADVSFISTGSPKGDGWPAGGVLQSYMFTAYPRVDSPCLANITGLRLWRLISEASFETFAFTSSYGARLIQMSGVKIEYAIQPDGFGKVISIDVLNKTTGEYEPLQRLRYYTLASTNYHCDGWTDLLRKSRLYDGESVDATHSNQLIQFLIADYMRANDPFVPLFDNYYIEVSLINNTNQTYLEYELASSSCTNLQWYDSGLSTCFDCPDGYQQSPYDISSCSEIPIPTHTEEQEQEPEELKLVEQSNNLTLIIAAAGGGGLLLVVVVAVAVLCEWRRRSGSRSNHNAPNGSSDVAVVFTDIKTSTKLWGAAPASMGVALDAHHHLIRKAIGAYRGYEVKTVGDSFMIVVDDPQRAVNLAVSIQNALYDYEWPTAIDDAYSCNFNEAVLDDPEDVCGPEEGVGWNGLRVRIGIHYGPVEVILDEVTKGYDYYGTTVNVAARVEGVTDGGQVCASAAVMTAVSSTTDTYSSILLAKTALRGVREDVEVYEIRSTHLPARTFNNPLIFDEGAKVAMLAQESESHDSSMSTNQTRLSQRAPLTRTTRPIRNIVREAFKAIRGAERVQMLEKLRSAWRVELPSGKAFKGITAAQLAWKEKNSGKDDKGMHHRKKTRMAAADIASLGVHGGSGHGSQVTEMSAVSGTNYDDTATNASSRSHTKTDEYDGEEDEEDIMFRVIAQRVEPSVHVLFKKEDERRGRVSSTGFGNARHVHGNLFECSCSSSTGPERGGNYTALNGSAVLIDVVDPFARTSLSSAGGDASRSSSLVVSVTRSRKQQGTESISHLFDVKSLGGGGGSSSHYDTPPGMAFIAHNISEEENSSEENSERSR